MLRDVTLVKSEHYGHQHKINCLILGAAKSGTTSLFNYLSSHPDLSLGSEKEIHYFDWKYDKGEDWYESQFSSYRKYRIEATPYYLFHPIVPARVFEYNPDCKFLLILRNPSDRAISHYYHNVRLVKGNYVREDIQQFIPLQETLSMADAFRREEERIQDQYKIAEERRNEKSYNNPFLQHYSYIARGRYVEQIERWYQYFPRENFLILDFEVLSKDPRSCLEEVYDFLQIRKEFPTGYTADNIGVYEKNTEVTQLKKKLTEYYRPYNQQLMQLTGKKFEWMKN